ncbi:Uncharacterised protein [Mycobacteroides abscessus subsp. abscessus]|nr:Uncharacterised protein [Mycobacteroides abscessus subsp. abscessus]SKV60641.1 Uncharacterised protein [Mycobacteroides abscessus subsp. abscessus]
MPPKYPASAPTMTPMINTPTIAMSPMVSETLAPYTTLA